MTNIKSENGIIWVDTGLSVSEQGYCLHCYTWNNCIMMRYTSGRAGRAVFVTPDGHKFFSEESFLKHVVK